jgi:hypothetical protein
MTYVPPNVMTDHRRMKILILFIYSPDEHYNKMLQIQKSYCHNYENVHSFFVTYRGTQTNDVEVDGDMVYVRGEETYLGITRKTIDAMEFLLNHLRDIDYVVRSNMSTVIHIPELTAFCESLPKTNVYTSGMMNELRWLDPASGVVDKSLWGTKYASGTSIILSKDVAESIVKRKTHIRHDIIDDLSIGVFMTTFLPDTYGVAPLAKLDVVPFDLKPDSIDTNAVFYRTRTDKCRKKDIQNMQTISDLVYNTKEGFSSIDERMCEDEVITYSGIVLGVVVVIFGVAHFIFEME